MLPSKYPTKKTAIIELLPYAQMFHDQFEKYLISPAPGVYVRGEIAPRMRAGTVYRQTVVSDAPDGKGVKAEVPVTYLDIDQIESPVFDDVGEVVIGSRHLHLLSSTPTAPAVALQLIYKLMDFELEKLQEWTSYGRGLGRPKLAIDGDRVVEIEPEHRQYDLIMKFLNQATIDELRRVYGEFEYQNSAGDVMVDLLEDMIKSLATLRMKVASFVGDDNWCVHFMHMDHPHTLVINKSVDYRIIDWHVKNNVPVDY